MKKRDLICRVVCITILAAIVLHVQIITLGNGEKIFVYHPLFDHGPGSSVGVALRSELAPLYGEDNDRIEKRRGENTVVYDTSSYDIKYLGRSVAGGDYIRCEITTTRTVMFDDESREPHNTKRKSVYIGYDDADYTSIERAKILWDTLREEYSDSEEYFNSIVLD